MLICTGVIVLTLEISNIPNPIVYIGILIWLISGTLLGKDMNQYHIDRAHKRNAWYQAMYARDCFVSSHVGKNAWEEWTCPDDKNKVLTPSSF